MTYSSAVVVVLVVLVDVVHGLVAIAVNELLLCDLFTLGYPATTHRVVGVITA